MKLRSTWLAVILLLAVLPLWGQQKRAARPKVQRSAPPGPVQTSHFSEAAALLQAGRLAEAEAAARLAVAAAPSNADAHNLLGVILDQRQQNSEAESAYRQALRLNPQMVSALSNLGVLLARTQRADEAIAAFEKVLRLAPAHPQANFNLGLLYGAAGHYEKAIAPLEKVAGGGDPSVSLLLLNAYLHVQRKEDALRLAETLEQQAGQNVPLLFNLGLTLAENGEYAHAASIFQRTDELRPDTAEVLYNLGIVLYNLNRLDEAAQALTKAARLSPTAAEIFYRLGLVESAQGHSEQAIDQWLQALTLRANYPEANFVIAEELVKNHRNEQSLDFYRRAVEQDPQKLLYYVRWGGVHFRAKRYEEARDIFVQAAGRFPDEPGIHYFLGMAARGSGAYDLAETELKRALKMEPGNADALAHLGFIAVERDQPQEAEKILRQVIAMSAEHFPAHYDLGRLFVRTKRYAEAVTLLHRGEQLSPNDPGVHYQLFLALSRLKRKDEAEKELSLFRSLQPAGKNGVTPAEPDKNATLPADLPGIPGKP